MQVTNPLTQMKKKMKKLYGSARQLRKAVKEDRRAQKELKS